MGDAEADADDVVRARWIRLIGEVLLKGPGVECQLQIRIQMGGAVLCCVGKVV